MIQLENVTFTYPGATNPTLNKVSLHIKKGDFLAIIGNNGCGKSTLCKAMNGLIPHFIVGDMEGKVMIDGVDSKAQEVGSIAKKVGYVYQDFENQIVCPTVLEDASFACLNYAMTDYKERGREALAMCGLSHKVEEYIWQLSGGQKHLLALASMMALSPEVLILDEPIAQLDPLHAKEIYDLLKELNEVYNKTIIVIEHHTEFIARYCKSAVLMKDGEIVWRLPAKEALRRVEELEESNIFPPQITVAARKLQTSGVLPKSINLPVTLEEGVKVFQKKSGENVVESNVRKHRKAPVIHQKETTPVVEFKQVSVAYRVVKGEEKKTFEDLCCSFYQGDKIALIGSNGAGKSTLMKLMVGLLKPKEGEVCLHGKNTRRIRPEQLSQTISLVYQNPEEMFIKDSIRGDIEYAMKVRGVSDYEARTQELLKMFRLTELADRDGRLLSGGQMRRASLAIGIALNPGVLLLDEPTANLDIATRKEILKTLIELKDVTETVVIATHDMQLVCDWADRIIVLTDGEVIADGERNQVYSDEKVRRFVGIKPPEIYDLARELGMPPCYTVDEFIEQYVK